MIKEKDLLENNKTREEFLERVDVLEKVKELILLGDSELATTQQVADYYEVGFEAIQSLVKDNREELTSNGLLNKTGKEVKSLGKSLKDIANFKGYFTLFGVRMNNRNNLLFQKRTILNVGMLLRDSEIAKQIRNVLLDITQDVCDGKDNVRENIIEEIDEKKQIQLDIVQAMMDGDTEKESLLKTKLIGLQNKRINYLENKIELIHTHSLSIIESRNVINKLTRKIASKEYSNFGTCYNDLYKQINYKLGINIKLRKREKGQSYLDVLTQEEIFKTEEIVRCWADKIGLDLKEELNLAI